MENENIDIIDFMNSRAKEIETIEGSIKISHKKSLVWQRLPYYKRRRNRNYDKRTKKKFTFRKKDRHFLRTHTFYAKRFFMLKLENYSIPITRRIKSSKYIYKSQHRGFIFDESFRKAFVYSKLDLYNHINENPSKLNVTLLNIFNSNENMKISCIENEFEIIIENTKIISIGRQFSIPHIEQIDSIISVIKNDGFNISVLKGCDCTVYARGESDCGVESAKILCKRSVILSIFEKLSNLGFISICLDEIHRLALENNKITIYDNVKTELFKEIENAKNTEIITKYNRTPAAKKQKIDLDKLFLVDENVHVYFIFKILKGHCKYGAEIFTDDECIGRVVRSDYQYRTGNGYGLGFLYSNFPVEEEILFSKNLDQRNFYEITIVKYLKV